MKLTLGTWGFYKPSPAESIDSVLEYAVESAIYYFDTALVYGGQEAEKALGRLRKKFSNRPLHITTKIPGKVKPWKGCSIGEIYTPEHLEKCLESSINNLGAVETILLHNWSSEFTTSDYRMIFEIMNGWKEKGLCQEIGVSLPNGYGVLPQEDLIKSVDTFMLPINSTNLFNREIGLKLKDLGKKVMVRSLFEVRENVPSSIEKKKNIIADVAFADEIVIGTTNRKHLSELKDIVFDLRQ
ncbi:MAG: aldo/keto reductase [Lachnospiraceae bacterium]|nr:aldo/keto reductase [Lachnospiraceae bacterium]